MHIAAEVESVDLLTNNRLLMITKIMYATKYKYFMHVYLSIKHVKNILGSLILELFCAILAKLWMKS